MDTFYNVYHLHYQESETLKKDVSKCSYLASCGHYYKNGIFKENTFLPGSHHMGHMSSNNFLLRRTFSELPRGMGDCIWMTEQMNRLTGTVPLKKRRNRLTTNFCNKVTFTKVLTDPDKIYNVAKKVFEELLKRAFLDLLSLT